MADNETPLAAQMRALAEAHERRDDLLAAADTLDAAVSLPIPQMIGAWAKARRLWCECTGEDLV